LSAARSLSASGSLGSAPLSFCRLSVAQRDAFCRSSTNEAAETVRDRLDDDTSPGRNTSQRLSFRGLLGGVGALLGHLKSWPKHPFEPYGAPRERTNVQVPMKRAHLMVLQAYRSPNAYAQKNATYPITTGVRTLVRSEIRKLVPRMFLPRLRVRTGAGQTTAPTRQIAASATSAARRAAQAIHCLSLGSKGSSGTPTGLAWIALEGNHGSGPNGRRHSQARKSLIIPRTEAKY
jgi:hypothetical protein